MLSKKNVREIFMLNISYYHFHLTIFLYELKNLFLSVKLSLSRIFIILIILETDKNSFSNLHSIKNVKLVFFSLFIIDV